MVYCYNNDNYLKDTIKAVDAKLEVQKIIFAPLVFQAVRSLFDFGILEAISDSGEKGLTIDEITQKTEISSYATGVLLEIALGINVVKIAPSEEKDYFVLGKIGWFLMDDERTRISFNFVNDVCYKGAFDLTRSLKEGKPLGIEVFNTGKKNIYEALPFLPEQVQKSWFEFDHFFSDIGFEPSLPIVFAENPKKIIDIGGNTAKWAIRCCSYNHDVEVLIVDLPDMTKIAEQKAAEAGFHGRISTFSCNILDNETIIPSGADAIWMSQMIESFSLADISRIMKKVRGSAGPATNVYLLEPLWDKQSFGIGSFSLQALSLYFSCMVSGNSKVYRCCEVSDTIEKAGFDIIKIHHNLGLNDYSLIHCRVRSS